MVKSGSADLINSITARRNQLLTQRGISISFRWIEGHQLEKYGTASYDGLLNAEADYLAQEYTEDYHTYYPAPSSFELEGPSISISGIKQEHFDFDLFYDLTYGEVQSRQYWITRHLNPIAMDKIDWPTVGLAMKSMETSKQH